MEDPFETVSKRYLYKAISDLYKCTSYHDGYAAGLEFKVTSYLEIYESEFSNESLKEIRLALKEAVEGFEERRDEALSINVGE